MTETAPQPPPAPVNGFLRSLTTVFVTLVEMSYTRLELVMIELQEGAEGLLKMLVWSFVALFAAGAGLFIGALALIFAFWDTHRILVSVLLMLAFLLIALIALLVVLGKMRARHRLFASSLAEFAKDREMLRARL